MKKILGCIKRAQKEFELIHEGDVIGVGLSGGKDSMALFYALCLYRNFAPVSYTVKGITVDMGFEGFETERIRSFCEDNGAEFICEKTGLGAIIFNERKDKNPCGMCSRMRRGILHRVCEENGITRLALGHHGDDLIETFFMSLIYESRVNAFKAETFFDRTELVEIRPMIYAREQDVIEAVERHAIPVVKNPCPSDGNTARQKMKRLAERMLAETGQPGSHVINALCRSDIVR